MLPAIPDQCSAFHQGSCHTSPSCRWVLPVRKHSPYLFLATCALAAYTCLTPAPALPFQNHTLVLQAAMPEGDAVRRLHIKRPASAVGGLAEPEQPAAAAAATPSPQADVRLSAARKRLQAVVVEECAQVAALAATCLHVITSGSASCRLCAG